MYVAYINKKNKLTVTLVDGRDMAGVYWPSPTASGDIPMAFKRIVRNLQVLIVPGEEIEKKQPYWDHAVLAFAGLLLLGKPYFYYFCFDLRFQKHH